MLDERERERERMSQERRRKDAEEDRWLKEGVAAYVKKRDQRRAEEVAYSRGQSAAAKRAAHRPERAADRAEHRPDVPLGPSNRTNAYGQRKGGRGAIQRREKKQFLQTQAAGLASFADQGAAGGNADAGQPPLDSGGAEAPERARKSSRRSASRLLSRRGKCA